MSNSNLIDYTHLSPNCNKPRNHKIDKITIHHMAGNLTVERCGELFGNASRQASSNYGIGSDGRVGLYVDEANRAWTSGNAENDHRAITIEVANDGGSPDWHVSDKALAKLIDLCVDICKRNGIEKLNFTGDKNGNLTMHKWFQATSCPGPYLESKFPYIASEVNKKLKSKEVDDMWYKVQVGAFKNKANAENLLAELEAKGYNGFIVEVDDGNDAPAPAPAPVPSIAVGSKVKIKQGAKSYEGAAMADFVYNKVYTVDELKGERAVLDKNGLRTAFHIDNLYLV